VAAGAVAARRSSTSCGSPRAEASAAAVARPPIEQAPRPAAPSAPCAARPSSPSWRPPPPEWVGPDGVEPPPPPSAGEAWTNPGPPPGTADAPGGTTLPPEARALRADLLSLVDAATAHAAAPSTGALWSAPRPGGASRAPASARLPPSAASARRPTHEHSARGRTGGAPPSAPSWRELLSAPSGASQRELARPAHEARRARVFAGLTGWGRTGFAAVQGGRAALWLSAVPADRGGRGTIPGTAVRVAARLWLGAAPRPDGPRPRCSCGAVADATGRHFLAACPAQVARRTGLHHHIARLVAAALRRAPAWGAVAVEVSLDGTRDARRPDLRATAAATAAVTWADVSVASPWPDLVASRVRATPLRAVAAAEREAAKRAAYVPALPMSDPPHAFTPLVWEALGRVGPATDAWLTAALAGPQLAAVRAGLLLDVSVALWRSLSWAVAGGYAACVTPDDSAEEPVDSASATADALAWSGGDFRVPHFLRGATGPQVDSSPIACRIGD